MLLSESVMEQNRESAEAWFAVARLQFEAMERLTALGFNAHKSAFEDLVVHMRDLLNARQPADVAAANLALAQPSLEKALAHWRSIIEVALQSHNEIARTLQARARGSKDSVARLLADSDPGQDGTAAAACAFNATFAAAAQSCEALRILSDMAGGLVEGGFTAAMGGVKGLRSRAQPQKSEKNQQGQVHRLKETLASLPAACVPDEERAVDPLISEER